ncbi:MAG TPA: hypothetical protein VHE35_05405 [Kofleriaceae bacterium]|nr:hypothetical protein [Kofleriaceae bacterium]
MRATGRVALLAALLLALPARAGAQGDIPEPPEPSCQCEDGGPWVPCSECGGGSSGDSGDESTPRTHGVPPILKAAAYVVGGAVLGGMFVIAPAHTFDLFGKTQSVEQARHAWDDERERLAALELTGKQSDLFARDLDGAVQLAARPPLERAGAGYQPIDAPAPPAPWSPTGACGRVLAANDRLLEDADREATAHARSLFPTGASVLAAAREQAIAGIARATGTDKLRRQAAALQGELARADEMAAFLDELAACTERQQVEPSSDCLLVIAAKLNEELRPLLDELQAGAGEAHQRVTEAAAFYRGYLARLRGEVEKQAILAIGCQR